MSHIKINQVSVTSKDITTKDGKAKTLHFQKALLVRDDGVVLPVDISVNSPDKAHAPGDYAISDESFSAGNFNSIQFRLVLGQPVKKAA